DGEVHTDLANTPQCREDEFGGPCQGQPAARYVAAAPKWTSPAETLWAVPEAVRTTRQPSSSIVSKTPSTTPASVVTATGLPTPMARSSQSERIASSPAPSFQSCSNRTHASASS